MRVLLPMPIVLPLVAAALSLTLHRWPVLQRILGVSVMVSTLSVSVALFLRVEASGIAVTQVGGWPAPFGITLVADLFSAVMVVVSNAVVLAVLVYAIGHDTTSDAGTFFHPIYLTMTAGVSASFLTGDLFNLFVAFEVMLTSSYVLITLSATEAQVRSGMTYVVISLLSSTLFLTAVGFVYAATGTVNLAQLAERIPDLPPALQTAIGLLLLVVFGIKAAIFPLFFWLPDSYPTAPAPVTAIFAGLLTKVGVYAIVRTQTLLFPSDGPSLILLFLAGATMVVGVIGAISQDDVKRILSFHIVSQIGYMILGLGLFTLAGLAGAIFYIVHHILVKTALFLVGGLIERTTGTGALHSLGGLIRKAPALAVLFAIPALSLAGLPPFSGFVAKLALVDAGLSAERYVVIGVSLLVSLLTLFSMTKIWAGAFWGTPEPADIAGAPGLAQDHLRLPPLMAGATAAVVAMTLAVVVGAGGLYSVSERAGRDLLERDPYVEAVLP